MVLALLITGCAQQTFTVQNKPQCRHQRKPSPIIFVSGIGQKKTVDAAKICGGVENVSANRNPANIRKWIARFYYFRHLYPLEARVYCSHYFRMSCPSIWATLSALLINILLGSFQLLCIVISLSLRWNNPVHGCLPVGEAALSTPEAVRLHALDRQTALMCSPTTTSGNIITQSIIFSFSIS